MDKTILSHSAGGIGGQEAMELVNWLFAHPEFSRLAEKAGMKIYPAKSYRHIVVMKSTDIRGLQLIPPHDHINERVGDNLPAGNPVGDVLTEIMAKANELLEHHPINEERKAKGKLPANSIWFWAEGTAAELPNFKEQYGRAGAVISAVPLCHGIAGLIGLDVIHIPGATGELETNYEGKVQGALDALKDHDFVAVHLEGPDECTHNGDLKGKLQAIEWLDSRVVAPLLRGLEEAGGFTHAHISDHKTLTESLLHDGILCLSLSMTAASGRAAACPTQKRTVKKECACRPAPTLCHCCSNYKSAFGDRNWMLMEILTHAYAKLNLSLDVLDRMDNGYHSMKTIMQSVQLCDDILIKLTNDGAVKAVQSALLMTNGTLR